MTLEHAYDLVFGGVLAISPELYGQGVQKLADLVGRENDEAFKQDVRNVESKQPFYLD